MKNAELYALTGEHHGTELHAISIMGDRASAIQILEWSDVRNRRGFDLCSRAHPMLMIGQRLISYRPDRDERNPARVRPNHLGQQSSPVLALFLRDKDAHSVFNERNYDGDLLAKYTREALDLFAERYPDHFFIAYDPETGLLRDDTMAQAA